MIKEAEEPKDQIATKQDIDDILSALKELTKAITELTKENTRWFKAGKMGG